MQTYLSVVTPDVQASSRKVVFLDEFNSRHKASDSNVVWAMLLKKYQINFHSSGIILHEEYNIDRVNVTKLSREKKRLTVLALGMRNSPGSSTSAVDVVKLLRKRHLSSKRNEL